MFCPPLDLDFGTASNSGPADWTLCKPDTQAPLKSLIRRGRARAAPAPAGLTLAATVCRGLDDPDWCACGG